MIRARTGRALLAGALLALATAAHAQDLGLAGDPGAKVEVGKATVSSREVKPGTTFEVRIPLAIEPEWHIYSIDESFSIPTSVKVDDWPAGLSESGARITPEAHAYGEGEFEQMVHEGDVVFTLSVAVAPDATPGERELAGTIRWMPCDATGCLPDDEAPWSVTVTVGEPSKARLGAVVAEPEVVAAGGSTRVRLPVTLDESWHVYGLAHEGVPTKVVVDDWPEGLSDGGVLEHPQAARHETSWGDVELIHEGEVTFSQVVAVATDAAPGVRTLRGHVEWMTCDASTCLTPEQVPFAVDITVAPPGEGASAPPADVEAAVGSPPAGDDEKGLSVGLLLQAIGFGLLTFLTPCVFPMLPLTVSFFSKQKGPALPRTIVYGAGWVFTIVVIGLIFASFLDIMARESWFNLAIGVVFIVLALSLFGMFDLRLPGALSDGAQKQSTKGGMIGAFFMAVTLALTSFSCSVPFLGIMFARFDGGEYLTATIALTVYAVTLALPFMVCSLIPSLLSAMPRAGSWMNAVKVTMGFVELAFALKFLRVVDLNMNLGVLSREFVYAMWIACALGAAVYLFGYLVLPHDTKAESIGVVRMVFGLFFLALAVYLVPGAMRRPMAPALDAFVITFDTDIASWGGGSGGGGGGAEEEGHLAWVKNDWDGTLERARDRGVPVLFDFTGFG